MPGILPMKVIKVGNSSQARIAQACDRCRSKKIKCDGIRPCCSQCANVGFECKTSDKLSRRAFPRGYTESLEERVRSLEAEVRELKDLLDEKDEKIDMLSKMHENRRPSQCVSSSPPTPDSQDEASIQKDDIFRVHASPLLLGSEGADSHYMGSSSGRTFVDAFKRKIQESGKSCSAFNTDSFLNRQNNSSNDLATDFSTIECIPPRLFSDRCVQVFWQEWAPLFPVLNKTGFIRLYEEYVANPEKMTDNCKLAQLHLVFGIAALSSNFVDEEQIALCEHQWKTSLDAFLMDSTLLTLQCLILASIYCLLKGDYRRLQQYKGVGTGLSYRLGLHQCQKRFSLGALTLETRKKVFWTLYTVDCFSAAATGLPVLLKDEDIQCEFPSDVDDEYITEKGFLPTLPGEPSKISSAIALFRVSRILSKVLRQNYPAVASHDLSLQSLSALEADLDEWSDNLPARLKLTFVQDKPSTNITGDRSALLSLAYYYIRTLIYRPVVGSSLGSKASSAVISLAESGKHIIQIVQLLEERSMSFSFCLNRHELLTLCGLSQLYQGLDLKQEGKLMKDGQRLVCWVIKYLDNANAPGAADFRRLAASMIVFDNPPNAFRRSNDSSVSGFAKYPTVPSCGLPKQPMRPSLYSGIACVSETNLSPQNREKNRTASFSEQTIKRPNISRNSLELMKLELPKSRRDQCSSIQAMPTPTSVASWMNFASGCESKPNLDYLPLDNNGVAPQRRVRVPFRTSSSHKKSINAHNHIQNPAPITPMPASHSSVPSSVTPAEWESLLSALDSGASNIYDAVYGGPSVSLMSTLPNPSYLPCNPNTHDSHGHLNALEDISSQHQGQMSHPSTNPFDEWSPELWDMAALNMHDFEISGPPHSVLSYSEDSLSSADDLDARGLGSSNSNCKWSAEYGWASQERSTVDDG